MNKWALFGVLLLVFAGMVAADWTPAEGYTQYKIRIDGTYKSVSISSGGLTANSEVVNYTMPGDPMLRKRPGSTHYGTITFKAPIAEPSAVGSPGYFFYDWWQTSVSGSVTRKDILLDIFNNANVKKASFMIYRCWISDYEVKMGEGGIWYEYYTLQYESFQRDREVV